MFVLLSIYPPPRILSAVLDVKSAKETGTKVDTINLQMVFIFAIIWGLCATIPEESKRKFDTYFRNLMDGLIKGFSKPASFKLARSNLFGDQGTIFEYTINPETPGTWCRWQDQVGHMDTLGQLRISPRPETSLIRS